MYCVSICFGYILIRSGNLVMGTREEMITLRIGFWRFLKIQVECLLFTFAQLTFLSFLVALASYNVDVTCTSLCDNKVSGTLYGCVDDTILHVFQVHSHQFDESVPFLSIIH